jgi:imidazolonepropionase-like amidohydrolase
MADAGTVAVLLPAATFFIREQVMQKEGKKKKQKYKKIIYKKKNINNNNNTLHINIPANPLFILPFFLPFSFPTLTLPVSIKARPPVEQFRQAGVPMAIATNCNPGSAPCTSLLLCMNMGCTLMGMTPEEVVIGVTRNAAKAIGKEKELGTIEIGKQGDFAGKKF